MKIFKTLSAVAAIAACLGASSAAVASDTVKSYGAAKLNVDVQIAQTIDAALSASNLFLSEGGRQETGAVSNAVTAAKKAEQIVNVAASVGVQTGQSAPAHKATVDHSVAVQNLDTTDQSACGPAAAENSWQAAYFSDPALAQARDYVQSDQQAALATPATIIGQDSPQAIDQDGTARYLTATADYTSKQSVVWQV